MVAAGVRLYTLSGSVPIAMQTKSEGCSSELEPTPQQRKEAVGQTLSATLVTCVKNEASYLLEWIAFHRVYGFDTLIIYDNESTDNTRALLEPLAAHGEIEYRFQQDLPEIAPQVAALRDAHERCTTEWIAFLDADEFLLLHQHRSVGEFLAGFGPEVSQVCINWRLFGSSGQAVRNSGLVIERFRMASMVTDPVNAHVKSFTRTKRFQTPHVHAPFITGGLAVYANGEMRWMRVQGIADSITHQVASIHHYAVKSRAEFEEKIARGRGDHPMGHPDRIRKNGDAFFAWHDTNAAPDADALARIDEVRAEFERLCTIAQPGDTVMPTGAKESRVRPSRMRQRNLATRAALRKLRKRLQRWRYSRSLK